MYPYKFKSLADGGKWCHRNDDLDTIFDINNQGRSGKKYSVLVGDTTETGSVFRGDNSVFWTLIKDTQQEEIKKMMLNIFKAMTDKAIKVGYSGTPRQQLIGCIRHFFWDNAQEYFAPSAYNVDAEWTYEDAWAIKQGSVAPLTQALGSHYEAEKDFVAMRMLFLASYYNFAPFNTEADEDKTEGQLKYRGSSAHTYRITTAADFRPMIITGESSMASADGRVESGQTVEINVAGTSGADTTISIQGLDWISDLGDMSTLVISADDPTLSISSKRLSKIKIGDAIRDNVKSNIKTLSIGSCPSMTIVDAQNLGSLTGTIDLASLPRLREAYFGGTDVRGIKIPKGAKIEKLQIPVNISSIDFRDLKYLQDFNYENLSFVEDLRIEGCDSLNAFNLLSGAYNAEKSSLKNISITDFTADGNATDMDMLANLVNDKDKDGNDHIYNGLDADGNVLYDSNPVIDGTFNAVTPLYEDSLDVVTTNYPKLNINESGIYYQRFKDKEVLRVLNEKGVGDGLGVVKEDWANVSDIATWFKENTEIVSLQELGLTNVTSLKGDAFYMCEVLNDIDCSKVTSINARAFYKCTALSNIKLGDVTSLGGLAFFGCINLEVDISFPNLTGEITQVFEGSGILSCSIPKVTALGNYCFSTCKNLVSVDISSVTLLRDYVFINCYNLATVIGSNIKKIGSSVFINCASLTSIDIPSVQFLGISAFENCKSLTSIDIRNVTNIEKNAFYNCKSLTEAIIPNVQVIGDYAFYGCKSLSGENNLPDLTSVGDYAFTNASITSFVAPKTQALGSGAFYDCVSLASVNLSSAKTFGANLFRGCKSLTEVNISSAETLSGSMFMNCTVLKTIDISNVKVIDASAFYQCSSLISVNMPIVESIDYSAFYNCNNLTGDLNLPLLTNAGNQAFYNTKITSFVASNITSLANDVLNACTMLTLVDVGAIEAIGDKALYGCSKLTTFVCRATTPPSLGTNALGGTSGNLTIYVPDQSVDTYKNATGWADYASRIKGISELPTE